MKNHGHPSRPETGKLIGGRDELVAELARGGMGSVWSARDGREQRDVAIKFQAFALVDSTSDRRFAREADALCRLESEHVVRCLDAGDEAGLSYIVMERLVGETLRDRLKAAGPLAPVAVARLVGQAALGLSAAHAAGIVHRDVKLSNLFVTRERDAEVLRVIDFGLAKPSGLGTSGEGTASGVVGSPSYMSPEQARGERVDERTDVWALAVVAFTLLSGREPFTEADVPATLQRICCADARVITELVPALPAALDDFFARAFAQHPDQRFQTVLGLSAALEQACSGAGGELFGRLDETRSLALSKRARAAPRASVWPVLVVAILVSVSLTVAATSLPRWQAGAAVPASRAPVSTPVAVAQPPEPTQQVAAALAASASAPVAPSSKSTSKGQPRRPARTSHATVTPAVVPLPPSAPTEPAAKVDEDELLSRQRTPAQPTPVAEPADPLDRRF